MNTAPQFVDLTLAKRAVYQLPDTARQITCRSGTLWITQDHDLRDIILASGESFSTDGRHKVIAYALDPATLTVRSTSAAATPVRKTQHSPAARGLVVE